MTPLDLVVRATVHDGPGPALHARLVDALAGIDEPSNAAVSEALARFEAEADSWSLWCCFSKSRLRCLQRGIADARQYDVAFDYSPPPPNLATWFALREMAAVRVAFTPWNTANVVTALRALAPRFRELGAARVQLFGSVARGEWRESSDIDLMIYAAAEDPRGPHGIANAIIQECGRVFGHGYGWNPEVANGRNDDFPARIAAEAIEVLL